MQAEELQALVAGLLVLVLLFAGGAAAYIFRNANSEKASVPAAQAQVNCTFTNSSY